MAKKKSARIFISRIKIKFRRLIQHCPRRLRIIAGPLLGGAIGLIGGIPGFIIGLLLGSLLRKIYIQSIQDRRILNYFENPGIEEFYEGEDGAAAWCALGVLTVSKNQDAFTSDSEAERVQRQVILGAARFITGPHADPYMFEHLTRLAWSNKESLNPDLLAESLAARRISKGDAADLAQALCALAESEEAKKFSLQIGLILDPSLNVSQFEPQKADAWKILGLPRGTPLNEVKAHYRRLAKQFHPDELEVLGEKQRETAARAFIAIKDAYKQIAGG